MIAHADVLIVGGGPIGMALALAIAGSDRRVALIEARAAAPDDARTLAISQATALLLQRLGLSMASLDATPIEAVHVSQRGGFGRTILHCTELQLPALGYVVSYAALCGALEEALTGSNVSVVRGAKVDGLASTAALGMAKVMSDGREEEVTARLIVLADGGRSVEKIPGIAVTDHDYRQSALVALVASEPAAQTLAYERFTPGGPLALLPYRGRYALIWTASAAEVASLASLEIPIFLERLQQHFGMEELRFSGVESRATFPLRLRFAKPVTSRRIALVGNAAQALHPVAGQGFNLGMRDVQALARCIGETERESLGDAPMLSRYRSLRRWDAGGGVAATDFLVRGFSSDNRLLRIGRGMGLAALDILPPARKWLARKMIFGISG